jgi:hypothetical protein
VRAWTDERTWSPCEERVQSACHPSGTPWPAPLFPRAPHVSLQAHRVPGTKQKSGVQDPQSGEGHRAGCAPGTQQASCRIGASAPPSPLRPRRVSAPHVVTSHTVLGLGCGLCFLGGTGLELRASCLRGLVPGPLAL